MDFVETVPPPPADCALVELLLEELPPQAARPAASSAIAARVRTARLVLWSISPPHFRLWDRRRLVRRRSIGWAGSTSPADVGSGGRRGDAWPPAPPRR